MTRARRLLDRPARLLRLAIAAVGILVFSAFDAGAQRPGPPATPPGPPASAKESAAIDITGNWVAIVNEDWRWRMVTPPKGDYMSVQPLNAEGRKVADTWEPSQDGSCRAYGAAGLLRMPTRLRIRWDGDATLVLETDAGEQTRELRFDATGAAAARSLQGHSVAEWKRTLPPPGNFAVGGPGLGRTQGGSLAVTTTNLTAGWLRKNGVPYSEQTVLTEYFDRFPSPNGDEWLMVTTIVEDPVYLNGRFITSSHFKREPNGAKWNPTPCKTP